MRTVLIESPDAAPVLREDADEAALLRGKVAIDVAYSSLNYKDALALAGRGIARTHPLIPGIDLVGTVTESADPAFSPGQTVVLTGDGIGESHHGGFATRARVRPDALVLLPEGFTAAQAAAIGTAGFTAMLAVLRLEDAGLTPEDGDVLVTGASGGAGSIAVMLLAARGHRVIASTGRARDNGELLLRLGAAELIDRAELGTAVGRPLASQRWAAAVDGVGSTTLANVLSATRAGGTVAAYGLAQGSDLPTTVMPFILRGVTLAGVDSVHCPRPLRDRAWAALAAQLDTELLGAITTTVGLAEVLPLAEQMLEGAVRGRTVVEVSR